MKAAYSSRDILPAWSRGLGNQVQSPGRLSGVLPPAQGGRFRICRRKQSDPLHSDGWFPFSHQGALGRHPGRGESMCSSGWPITKNTFSDAAD